MDKSRIGLLNKQAVNVNGRCVVYVMSRDQRSSDNHALLRAQEIAQQHELPLVVLFVLLRETGYRTREHFTFMLEGLREVRQNLLDKDVGFILRHGDAKQEILSFYEEESPAAIVFDFSPLKGPREVTKAVAESIDICCEVVDTHNIIPVWTLSDKKEFAAHTIRRKVHAHIQDYIEQPATLEKMQTKLSVKPDQITFAEAEELLEKIPKSGIDVDFEPGEKAATKRLNSFIDSGLKNYANDRNNPTIDGLSGFSPYLHFGHISSLRIAFEVITRSGSRPLLYDEAKMAQSGDSPSGKEGMNALLEEMIVRKELSDNFCFYSDEGYTSLKSAEGWAQATLAEHTDDKREFTYSIKDWEEAETHDPAWNAAQKQMSKTGKMHGYMRMYWAKKLLEWSKTPEDALKIAIYLNDKYSIDGGDPNGYVGILWSIAGVHDRAWTEREVFGKIRYMNYGGLKRKFDIKKYIEIWDSEQTSLID